ncbi:MAG TPA: carboxypeptidase-like regulatory domain-containing protein [Lacipirellulaceae bacterium]|nr:carboxypeptidase-like regulatory domain-containing protein [Lacipirellulaceae bacterium]HMP05729.1 carboxypeptidase-like regulatory domain-containing protein [Lacipirellulaceae bacterium]
MATTQRARLRWPQGLLAIAALAAAGCGGSGNASITGTVTRPDGTPAEGLRVIARSAETGKWGSGVTDHSGKFTLGNAEPGDGLPPGDYAVTIVEDTGGIDQMSRPTIAVRYGNPDQSGLSFSVAAGEKKVFDVTVDPP